MFRSPTSSTLTDADRAAMRRRPPVTLASWKRDAQADDDIVIKSKAIQLPTVTQESSPASSPQTD